MATPFDDLIEVIRRERYHKHRGTQHSDVVSNGIFRDLLARCPAIARDCGSDAIKKWLNVSAPGKRQRRIDLFVGEPDRKNSRKPAVRRVRICGENKSVVTAHRNRTNRTDDLEKVLSAIHRTRAEAIVVATVLVGTAPRVLNVPDHVKKAYRHDLPRFDAEILPRLSSGDHKLWAQFPYAISDNEPEDAAGTVEELRKLPTRRPGHTHRMGFDFVMIVPVFIDNVNPPTLCRDNPFGIDIDADYQRMIKTICRAYKARWHM